MRALFCASTKWCASAASKPPPSAVPSIMASEIAPVSEAAAGGVHAIDAGARVGAQRLAPAARIASEKKFRSPPTL